MSHLPPFDDIRLRPSILSVRFGMRISNLLLWTVGTAICLSAGIAHADTWHIVTAAKKPLPGNTIAVVLMLVESESMKADRARVLYVTKTSVQDSLEQVDCTAARYRTLSTRITSDAGVVTTESEGPWGTLPSSHPHTDVERFICSGGKEVGDLGILIPSDQDPIAYARIALDAVGTAPVASNTSP